MIGTTRISPFEVLGLSPAADLTDDDVRAAWRRIAEATHPDRADGGDPGRFAAAASAYTDLRTTFGRGEARAALGADTGRVRVPGSPARLVLRSLGVLAVGACGILAAGPGPAAPALAAGALTWLVAIARRDWRRPRS